jgi:hypothetical protein
LAGQLNASGDSNVYIGNQTGQNNIGHGNVYIGRTAGLYQTSSNNQIIIDAGGSDLFRNSQTSAYMIVGQANLSPANQTLSLNANTTVSQNLTVSGTTTLNILTTSAGGDLTGNLQTPTVLGLVGHPVFLGFNGYLFNNGSTVVSRSISASDVGNLSNLYLPLSGGNLSGPGNLNVSGTTTLGALNGILKGNSGIVTTASVSDFPSFSGLYLPLSGGNVTGNVSALNFFEGGQTLNTKYVLVSGDTMTGGLITPSLSAISISAGVANLSTYNSGGGNKAFVGYAGNNTNVFATTYGAVFDSVGSSVINTSNSHVLTIANSGTTNLTIGGNQTFSGALYANAGALQNVVNNTSGYLVLGNGGTYPVSAISPIGAYLPLSGGTLTGTLTTPAVTVNGLTTGQIVYAAVGGALTGSTGLIIGGGPGQIILNSTDNSYRSQVTGQGTDGKYWDIETTSNLMNFRLINDAQTASTVFAQYGRVGMTFTGMTLNGAFTSTGNIVTPGGISAGNASMGTMAFDNTQAWFGYNGYNQVAFPYGFSQASNGSLGIYSTNSQIINLGTQSKFNTLIISSASTTVNSNLNVSGTIQTNATGTAISAPNGGATIKGYTDNSSAASGIVGEYIETVIPDASQVSVVNNTAKSIMSVSLTAGDWDIEGGLIIFYNEATVVGNSVIVANITSTTNTITNNGRESVILIPALSVVSTETGIVCPRQRVSITSTTTYYLVAQVPFTAGSAACAGQLTARRIR